MKVISILLSLYVFLLPAIPCADVIRFDSKSTAAVSQIPAQHSADSDCCSPFCTCHCCHADFFALLLPESESITVNDFLFFEHSDDFRSTHLFEFLIPPRA